MEINIVFTYNIITTHWCYITPSETCVYLLTLQCAAFMYSLFTLYVGIREVSWEIPCSGTKDISMLTSSSNVGEPGMWVFRVDGTDIIPACPNEGWFAHFW